MPIRLTALLAASLLAVACGGGNSTSSTTGGGTSSGTTTGGTTTGATVKLADGRTCASNTDCNSGVCGVNGTGFCCHASCGDAGATCDATACSETGACMFPPAGGECQPEVCANGSLTSYQCDGTGSCKAGTPSTCSGNLGCTADGTACVVSCSTSSDCVSGFVCNAGHCVVTKSVGACTENDDCFSNRCGVAGQGFCCTGTPCNGNDPTCGPLSCDANNGACLYPDGGTPCGTVLASCSTGTAQGASECDGQGTCKTPSPAACTPFVCGANACLTSCTDSSACIGGDYCDTNHGSCCSAFASGSTITVDATAGSDATACCSVPGYLPCQTLTEAMKQIDVAQAANVTINPVTRLGHTWAPPGEVYPIVLGWGVELNAPNIYFYDASDAGSSELFEIQAVSKNDTVGYASIVGTAKTPVTIGVDEFRDQSIDPNVILVGVGSTLYLANAQLDSNENYQTTAISIAAGGALVLAQDQSATVTGTVTIGYPNMKNQQGSAGFNGIVCQSSPTTGCTVTDTPLDGGASSVVIQAQAGADIDAEDNAKVTLTGNPQIGLLAGDAGFGVCSEKIDGADNFGFLATNGAVLLNGKATVDFENGIIQCIGADGIDLQASKAGTPTLTLVNSTIENTNTALNVFAGTATVTGSLIQFNGNGVAQTTDGTNNGTVNLNGGAAGNTVICSDSSEEANFFNGLVGVSVTNSTNNSLDADNVTWDTTAPDLFDCDPTLVTCTCERSSCTIDTADGGVDGMDAVEIGDAGAITTTGNSLSSAACNFPPPQAGCGIDCPPQCCVGQLCLCG